MSNLPGRLDPTLPADWSGAHPGKKPLQGFLPRISTIDPNAPDQVAAKALRKAAEELQDRTELPAEIRRVVGRAYLQATSLIPTEQQLRWAANEKLAESASAFLSQVGPDDVSLLAALRRGLSLMARGVICRVDDFAARDFILGSKIVAWVLVLYLDVAEAEEREAAGRAAEERQPAPVAGNSVRPPPPPSSPTSRPLPRAQTLPPPPRRGPGRPPVHPRDD